MGLLIIEGAVVFAAGVGATREMKRRYLARKKHNQEQWVTEVVSENGEWKSLAEWNEQFIPKKKEKKKKERIPKEIDASSQDVFRMRMQAKLLHFIMLRAHEGISEKLMDVVLEVTSVTLSHSQDVARIQQETGQAFASDINFSKLLNTGSAICLSYRFDKKPSQRQQFEFLRRKASDQLTELLIPTLVKIQERKRNRRTSQKSCSDGDEDASDNVITLMAEDLKNMILSQKKFVQSLLEQKIDEVLFQVSSSVDQGLDHVQHRAQAAVEESKLQEIQMVAANALSSASKTVIPTTLVSEEDQIEYARQAKAALQETNLTNLATPLLSSIEKTDAGELVSSTVESQRHLSKKGQAILEQGLESVQGTAQPLLDEKIRQAESIMDALVPQKAANALSSAGKTVIPTTLVSEEDQVEYVRRAKAALHEANVTNLAQPLLSSNTQVGELVSSTVESQLLSIKKGQVILEQGLESVRGTAQPLLDDKIQQAESIIDSLVPQQKESKNESNQDSSAIISQSTVGQKRGCDDRGSTSQRTGEATTELSEPRVRPDHNEAHHTDSPTKLNEIVSKSGFTSLSTVTKLDSSGVPIWSQPLNQTTAESLENAHAALKQTKDSMLATFQTQIKELVAVEMERLFQKILKALETIVFLIHKTLDGRAFFRELDGELDEQALKDKVFQLIDQSHHHMVSHVSSQVQTFVDMICGLLGLPPLGEDNKEDEEEEEGEDLEETDFEEEEEAVPAHIMTLTPYPRICPL